MKKRSWWVVGALLLVSWVVGSAQPRVVLIPFPSYPGDEKLDQLEITEDQVFFDRRHSRLVIVRKPTVGDTQRGARVETMPIDLAIRVAPFVSADVKLESPDRWLYRYTVGNEESARDSIESWRLDIPEPRSPDPFNPLDVAYPIDRLGVWEAGHFGYRPGSWAMRWSRKPNQPALTPGRSLDFLLEADRRPGFLMAYFAARRQPRPIPGDLPANLQRSIQNFLLSGVADGVVLWTLGPKFRKDQNPRTIAADFHVGISRLSNHAQLDPNSLFVRTCLDYLRSLVDDTTLSEPGLVPDFQANPETPLEKSVYQSLRLALELKE